MRPRVLFARQGPQLMERLLRGAAAGLAAVAADSAWASTTGEDLDDLERMRGARGGVALAAAAARVAAAFLHVSVPRCDPVERRCVYCMPQ